MSSREGQVREAVDRIEAGADLHVIDPQVAFRTEGDRRVPHGHADLLGRAASRPMHLRRSERTGRNTRLGLHTDIVDAWQCGLIPRQVGIAERGGVPAHQGPEVGQLFL